MATTPIDSPRTPSGNTAHHAVDAVDGDVLGGAGDGDLVDDDRWPRVGQSTPFPAPSSSTTTAMSAPIVVAPTSRNATSTSRGAGAAEGRPQVTHALPQIEPAGIVDRAADEGQQAWQGASIRLAPPASRRRRQHQPAGFAEFGTDRVGAERGLVDGHAGVSAPRIAAA